MLEVARVGVAGERSEMRSFQPVEILYSNNPKFKIQNSPHPLRVTIIFAALLLVA